MKNPYCSLMQQVYQNIRPPQILAQTEATENCMQNVLQLAQAMPVQFIEKYSRLTNTAKQKAWVHATQALSVNLADLVQNYQAQYNRMPLVKEERERGLAFYRQLLQSILDLLNLLQRNYLLQFNTAHKLPDHDQLKMQPMIMQFVRAIQEQAGKKLDPILVQILAEPLQDLYTEEGTATFSYACSRYWKTLIPALEEAMKQSQNSFTEILLLYNFNHGRLVGCIMQQHQRVLETLETKEESREYWEAQLRALKLLQPLTPMSLYPGLPDCKQILQTAIETELLQYNTTTTANETISGIPELPMAKAPIETTLSVTQLAGMIRLMVETGILTCENHTHFLKNIARTFTVRNQKAYSSDSLRQKYYHPDTASISILKTHLSNMLVQLKSYSLTPAILVLSVW